MIITLGISILLSLFSTAILSYISLATPIGPWIAPTLVLVGSLLFKLCLQKYVDDQLAYAVAAGSLGGIIATACGFSFPTLYFLAPKQFDAWIAQPIYFISIMTGLSLSAALFGYICAQLFEKTFLHEQKLAFPIGQLTANMIHAHDQAQQQKKLLGGFGLATIFSWLQGGFLRFPSIIPRTCSLLPSLHIYAIHIEPISLHLNMLPMLLAIGFIAGHLIALPLTVGILSKIFILDTIHLFQFSYLKSADFMFAFCSGMVVLSALQSFCDLPNICKRWWQGSYQNNYSFVSIHELLQLVNGMQLLIAGIIIISFLSWMGFSVMQQVYLLLGTFLSTYQICIIAGKIGLAQLGRFATFVMIPGLLLFGVHPIHATLTAAFVEISGGVATDLLFNKKMGAMLSLSSRILSFMQLFGILLASAFIGIIFWLLIYHFGLGSQELFAQRAQARALLISARHMDLWVLGVGALFGWILKSLKINPLLVLGGLLMPINYSISLMMGACLPYFFEKKDSWESFWSGVFAANSLWEMIKIIL